MVIPSTTNVLLPYSMNDCVFSLESIKFTHKLNAASIHGICTVFGNSLKWELGGGVDFGPPDYDSWEIKLEKRLSSLLPSIIN